MFYDYEVVPSVRLQFTLNLDALEIPQISGSNVFHANSYAEPGAAPLHLIRYGQCP